MGSNEGSNGDLPLRPVSGVERIWIAADRVASPFVNQLVVEGDGWPDPGSGGWESLVGRLITAQPGLRVCLRGTLRGSHWAMGGAAPSVQELDGSTWDGFSPVGAPWLAEPLDLVEGPVASILVLRGQPTRVIYRVHHAVTDGRGMQMMAEAVATLLRGEKPAMAAGGPQRDESVAEMMGVESEGRYSRDCRAPTGAAVGTGFASTWRRRGIPGRPSRLLGRMAVALASRVELGPRDAFRVDIPVDMRPHVPALRSTANLTGLVRVDVKPCLDSDDPIATYGIKLREYVDCRMEAAFVLGARFARNVPLALLTASGSNAARQSLRDGRYSTSATISNLGFMDMSVLSGGGFQARRAFFIPPGSPGLPLFMTVVGGALGVDIVGTMPEALASDGRLDALMDDLALALSVGAT